MSDLGYDFNAYNFKFYKIGLMLAVKRLLVPCEKIVLNNCFVFESLTWSYAIYQCGIVEYFNMLFMNYGLLIWQDFL